MADPYFDLPPMHPPSGAPPEHAPSAADEAPTDPIDDEVDDGSLDLSAPELDDDEGEENGEDAEDGDESDDRDWLIERAKKADEYERYLAQIKGQEQERRAVDHWNGLLQQIENEQAAEEEAIWQNANDSLNPQGYLRSELTKLNNKFTAKYAQYRDAREQALWQFAHAQAIPNHAARVVEHYKLPIEAVDELLDYAPELMEREAQKIRARLIKERNQTKQINQLKAKQAQRALGAPVSPGTGRAGGSGGAEKPGYLGSDEHYFAMPWSGRR